MGLAVGAIMGEEVPELEKDGDGGVQVLGSLEEGAGG